MTPRMNGRTEAAERAGAAQAMQVRESLAERARTFGGISATVDGDAVVLEGRGLLERWLKDADLRAIGRTGR
ncbi:MAG: hypothetical protein E2598_11900 [Sphingobium sp.]|nr:hypothetical protein [Sphingobium sp.]